VGGICHNEANGEGCHISGIAGIFQNLDIHCLAYCIHKWPFPVNAFIAMIALFPFLGGICVRVILRKRFVGYYRGVFRVLFVCMDRILSITSLKRSNPVCLSDFIFISSRFFYAITIRMKHLCVFLRTSSALAFWSDMIIRDRFGWIQDSATFWTSKWICERALNK
jgi:hypothetical protein